MASDKFKITQGFDGMQIEYRWFTYTAYFLIFFCIVWNGFLYGFMSAIGGNGMPSAIMLVPSIHIAVGVGLSYYTVCLFINKTKININSGMLTVKHAPLPWMGNKSIEVAQIKQLYVKQKINHNKNGVSIHYDLVVALHSGKEFDLLNSYSEGEAEPLQSLEAQIERYLKIKDYKMRGEYDSSGKISPKELSRESAKANPTQLSLENLRKGFTVDYDGSSWETVYHLQYDWSDGQTDRLFRVSGVQNSLLLYVRTEMGETEAWLEAKLDMYALGLTGNENLENLPGEFFAQGRQFYKESLKSGKSFIEGETEGAGLRAKQCFYTSSDKQHNIRVVQSSGGALSAFAGEKTHPQKFTEITG